MNREPKIVYVLPNPWCSVDGEGRPAGACPVDPDLFGTNYIGAWPDPKRTVVEKLSPQELKEKRAILVAPRQTTVWAFATKPLSFYFTGDKKAVLLRKLRRQELFPANEETAKVARIKFVPYERALKAAKDRARIRFEAFYGPGSFDECQRRNAEADAPSAAQKQPSTTEASDKASKGSRSPKDK